MNLNELATRLQAEVHGSGEVEILGVRTLETATASDIVFLDKRLDSESIKASGAGAFLVQKGCSLDNGRPFLVASNARLAFIRLLQLFEHERRPAPGLHPTVIQGKNCTVAPTATIMAGCVLGDSVEIEADAVLFPYCFVGDRARVGTATVLYPGVVVGHDCQIGNRCRISSGAVIGSDGFGYEDIEGQRLRYSHLGHVILEDEVEIGANTAIDRATLGATRVGRGTKVDNLVHIGHNCMIGDYCYLVAQVGLGGSARIGNWVSLGGQTGVSDHVRIGEQSIVAGKSAVREHVEAGQIVGGVPALPIRLHNEVFNLLPHLAELFQRVKRLEGAGASANGGAQDPGSEWRTTVLEILSRNIRLDPASLRPDANLKEEFGADSLTVLTVMTEIESTFDISIDDHDVRSLTTLNAIFAYLEKRLAADKES